MKKEYAYILGLSILGVFLSVYLFKLPKQVLKEKNKQLNVAENKVPESKTNHLSLSKNQEEKIKNLRSSFFTFPEKEKKRIFADSLAKAYLKVAYLDSAVKYIDAFNNLSSKVEDKQKVANLYYKAYNLEQRRRLKEKYSANAASLYKEIINSKPNLAAKTKLGVLLTKEGKNPMEGILLLREVLEEDSEYVDALFSLGEFSLMTQQFDKAVNRFEKIIEIEPNHIESLIYLGDSQVAIGNKNAAVEAYDKALEITKGDKFFEELLNQKLKKLTN